MVRLLLAATFASALAYGGPAPAARETVNFDFAWRHHLGDLGPEASAANYNASTWELVDAPHDMLIVGKHDPANSPRQGYLPRGVGWYRKKFALPAEWADRAVWLTFEAVFHETTIWLNDHPLGTHAAGLGAGLVDHAAHSPVASSTTPREAPPAHQRAFRV